MTKEKLLSEIETLKKFFTLYCKDKHTNQCKTKKNILYKNEKISFEFSLCEECHDLINYSIERLQLCPHEVKPRCRQCPSPCYEKVQWKLTAKMMKYSGFQLGILKIKKIFKLY